MIAKLRYKIELTGSTPSRTFPPGSKGEDVYLDENVDLFWEYTDQVATSTARQILIPSWSGNPLKRPGIFIFLSDYESLLVFYSDNNDTPDAQASVVLRANVPFILSAPIIPSTALGSNSPTQRMGLEYDYDNTIKGLYYWQESGSSKRISIWGFHGTE